MFYGDDSMKKTGLYFSFIFIVSGCTGVIDRGDIDPKNADQFQALNPTEALIAMSSQLERNYQLHRDHSTTSIHVSSDTAPNVINMIRHYCSTRSGKTSNWPGKPGSFNCLNPTGESYFSIKLSPVFFGTRSITVLERTNENSEIYHILLTGMGYLSPQQVLDEQRRKQEEMLSARNREYEKQVEMRLRNREIVSSVGARVCQASSYRGSPMILMGTVEQVAGDRVKVFIERAILPRTPALSPGGFKQHYSWVSFLDVEPCELNSPR